MKLVKILRPRCSLSKIVTYKASIVLGIFCYHNIFDVSLVDTDVSFWNICEVKPDDWMSEEPQGNGSLNERRGVTLRKRKSFIGET